MQENSKFRLARKGKLFIVLGVVVIIMLSYVIYRWSNTQSTDNAYVEADISYISSEVNGTVEKILVKENNYVEAGQVIAMIKDKDYEANFKKAEGELDSSRRDIEIIEQNIKLSRIDQQKAEEQHQFTQENYKILEDDYKRTKSLSQDNFATKKNLDGTKISFEKAKTELAQAEFSLQSSKENLTMLEIRRFAALAKYNISVAEMDLAKRALDNTIIRAPISGIIGNSSLREGGYVRAGTVLFAVIPIEDLYVKANFKETQISKFKPGMVVNISVDSEKGAKIEGKIRNISPATGAKFSLIPPANATGNFTKIVQRVPVIIDFTVPTAYKAKIVPGMSVVANIRTDQ